MIADQGRPNNLMAILSRHPAPAQACARTDGAQLRTYIDLNAHVIAEGLDGLYRLWLLARALDNDGRGVVGLDALLMAMQSVNLNRLHLRRVKLHPKARLFFSFHKTKIEYHSLEAVCLALGIPPGRSIYIPIASVTSTEEFRATLYAAWIAGHDHLHISRDKLAGIFQTSPDTQRRWEKLVGVKVTFNVVEVDPQDEPAAEPHIPKDDRLDPFDRLDRRYTWQYKGKTYYCTVNRYAAPHLERARLGNVRKVSRRVYAALPDEHHGVGTGQRVFFTLRTTPDNHQEQPGASIRYKGIAVDLPQGVSSLWRFHPWRPVARKIALCT